MDIQKVDWRNKIVSDRLCNTEQKMKQEVKKIKEKQNEVGPCVT